jgi:hypothetical protein
MGLAWISDAPQARLGKAAISVSGLEVGSVRGVGAPH